jgi:predicted transcriptional regulator
MPAERKKGTISVIKEKITVSDIVKEKSKVYIKTKKLIESSLKSGPKTIPQIAKEINLPLHIVTYYVMSLHKFGQLEAADPDDDDYYFYFLPK